MSKICFRVVFGLLDKKSWQAEYAANSKGYFCNIAITLPLVLVASRMQYFTAALQSQPLLVAPSTNKLINRPIPPIIFTLI